jgi:hypothetical protein
LKSRRGGEVGKREKRTKKKDWVIKVEKREKRREKKDWIVEFEKRG